jgi:microcystin-dependent protein
MAYPDPPTVDYSYTGFQESQGSNVFPGVQIDNDLTNIGDSIEEVVDFLKVAHAEDGSLKTGAVTRRTLGADVQLGLPAPRPWVGATAYVLNDTVSFGNGLYISTVAHTSAAFAADQAAGKWALLALFTVDSTPADNSVSTVKIQDDAVTRPKIGPGAVGATELDDGAVGVNHLQAGLGFVPIGAESDYAGVRAPSKWLFEYGQALSRTTYAALLAVLTETATVTTTLNSATLTAASKDLTWLGLEGSKIEGVGIPAGTTLLSITATTIVLSANATANGTGIAIRVFPYGNGDGSTTFNIPDRRSVVTAGRGNMGGANNNLLNSEVVSWKLGSTGGSERVTLDLTQIPTHDHGGHTGNAGTHNHPYYKPSTPTVQLASSTVSGEYAFRWFADTSVNNATTGDSSFHDHAISNAGGGLPHSNTQPTGVANKIIFAGV